MLSSLARKDGMALSPQFLSTLIKRDGLLVIPKHFVPPIIINTALGSCLWFVYAETHRQLGLHLERHHTTAIAAISGGVAGGAQAILAAPAENVRVLLEGGSAQEGWRNVWRDVFQGTGSEHMVMNTKEARETQAWMHEVRGMVGRGWEGWRLGVAKDIVGFAAFFALFDFSRRTANSVGRSISPNSPHVEEADRATKLASYSRLVHGTILVTGGVVAGVVYEFIGRPFEVMRTLTRSSLPSERSLERGGLLDKALQRARKRGISSFFQSAEVARTSSRAQSCLRLLGRVGPWGLAFWIWEVLGLGLD